MAAHIDIQQSHFNRPVINKANLLQLDQQKLQSSNDFLYIRVHIYFHVTRSDNNLLQSTPEVLLNNIYSFTPVLLKS